MLGEANCVREKTQEEPREIGAALAVGEPSGDGSGKIGLIEPCFHRCRVEDPRPAPCLRLSGAAETHLRHSSGASFSSLRPIINNHGM